MQGKQNRNEANVDTRHTQKRGALGPTPITAEEKGSMMTLAISRNVQARLGELEAARWTQGRTGEDLTP